MPTVHNYANHRDFPADEAVEESHGRWYIKMSFAGYNSQANNSNGYPTKDAAIAAILRYQEK